MITVSHPGNRAAMGLTCLVIPRAGLVPAECKRLGEALHRWLSSAPAVRSIEPLRLNDLDDILIEGTSWKRVTRDPAARIGTESTLPRENR
jgi:hypothetical protein